MGRFFFANFAVKSFLTAKDAKDAQGTQSPISYRFQYTQVHFRIALFVKSCKLVGMKSYREVITVNVPQRMDFVNITPKVAAAVQKSGIKEGLVLVNAMHITASVFINDDESGLHQDYKKWLEHLAPFDASPQRYAHNRTGEDNGDAHHKRQIMGREVVVALTEGKLDFGTWEQIFYGEFDGRRTKKILIKIIGE